MSAVSARRGAFAHAQGANDSAATIGAETSSLALPDALISDTLTMSIKGPTRRERNRNKPRFTKTIVCDVKQAMADYAAQQAAEAQRAQSTANSVTQSADTIVPPPSEAVLPSEEVSAPASIKTASAPASTLDSSAVEATIAGSVETLAETPAKHLTRRERNRNKPRFTKTMICDVKQAMVDYATQQAAEAKAAEEARTAKKVSVVITETVATTDTTIANDNMLSTRLDTDVSEQVIEGASALVDVLVASKSSETVTTPSSETTLTESIPTLADNIANPLTRRERYRNKPRFTKTMICDVKQAMADYAAQHAAEADKSIEVDMPITDAVTSTPFTDALVWHASPIYVTPHHLEATTALKTRDSISVSCYGDNASSLDSPLAPASPCPCTSEENFPPESPHTPSLNAPDLIQSGAIDTFIQSTASVASNSLADSAFAEPTAMSTTTKRSLSFIHPPNAREPILSLDTPIPKSVIHFATTPNDEAEALDKCPCAHSLAAEHVAPRDILTDEVIVIEPLYEGGLYTIIQGSTAASMTQEDYLKTAKSAQRQPSKLMKALRKAKRTLQKLGRMVCGRSRREHAA